MSSTQVFKVAVIGAGRIGSRFDSPEAAHILTHAHATVSHPRLELAALVDPDPAKRSEAERWSTRYFSDIDSMHSEVRPDAVVIASPDSTHAELLVRSSELEIPLIVCEKPVVASEEQERRVADISSAVIVNFSRRFDPAMQELRRDLAAQKFGRVLSASGIYTKGVFHNGSHMIDLARYLFGEMTGCAAHFSVTDFPEGEPSIAGDASFQECEQFHLIAADARAYAVFELDILCQRMRIQITDEGQTLVSQEVVDDALYPGFKVLGDARAAKTGLLHSLEALSDHMVKVLDGDELPSPGLMDALKTQAACRALAESLKML